MASSTEHYNLTLPAYGEQADIKVINDNMTIIDEAMNTNRDLSEAATVHIETLTQAVASTDRGYRALKKLNDGTLYDFETDESETQAVTVLTGQKVATVEKIGGKSVVWNQMNGNNGESGTTTGLTYTNNGDGTWTVTGTTTGSDAHRNIHRRNECDLFQLNHIYYLYTNSENISVVAYCNSTAMGTYATCPCVAACTVKGTSYELLRIRPRSNTAGLEVNETVRPLCFDLTQMFGITTVAQATDEMKSFCEAYAETHPEYSAGEIVSTKVTSVTSADETQTVPESITSLDGYGEGWKDSYNYVDFENKKYHKVGEWADLVWTPLSSEEVTDISEVIEPMTVTAGDQISYISETRLSIPQKVEFLTDLKEV